MDDLEPLIALDDVARSSEVRRGLIREGLGERRVSIALDDGVPKGYALTNDRFFGHAFIELVYVHPNARRLGIGSALVQYLVRNTDGFKLFTSTNQSNMEMQALLASLAFEESGIIHNLDPGDPEIVYFIGLSGTECRGR
jgi:ribosomal protein S18 acetylase RimI-like enzyme